MVVKPKIAFVPQKLAHRLSEYIRKKGVEPKQKILSISYPAARIVVKKAGELVEISLRPNLGKVMDLEAMRWIESLNG